MPRPLTKGLIQLAGDLGGTSDNPTVPDLALKAPLADPTFTGTPVAPTASDVTTSTTQIATTAFVQSVSGGKVANAINDAIITVAPSQNAVFDGLALKEDAANRSVAASLGDSARPAAPHCNGCNDLCTTATVATAAS